MCVCVCICGWGWLPTLARLRTIFKGMKMYYPSKPWFLLLAFNEQFKVYDFIACSRGVNSVQSDCLVLPEKLTFYKILWKPLWVWTTERPNHDGTELAQNGRPDLYSACLKTPITTSCFTMMTDFSCLLISNYFERGTTAGFSPLGSGYNRPWPETQIMPYALTLTNH